MGTQISPQRYMVQAGWDDVPHLDERTKTELLASTLPHLRMARSKGIPSLGSGAIYPIDMDEIRVQPFPIPAYFPRAYGLDVGWNRTAAIWGAKDPAADTIYLYSAHYQGQSNPSAHASAIRARGEWIRGAIDPAARSRSQDDGRQLLHSYTELGLNLMPAKNAVDAGLLVVWERLITGRLKVFSSLQPWFNEFRIYRRDEKGHIVKKFDHLMDATRYLVVMFDMIARLAPVAHTYNDALDRAVDQTVGY